MERRLNYEIRGIGSKINGAGRKSRKTGSQNHDLDQNEVISQYLSGFIQTGRRK
jgi:hypothetical protein